MRRKTDQSRVSLETSRAQASGIALSDELATRLESYRDLIDYAQAIVWRANARTFQFTFVSAYAETLLGYPMQLWTSEPTFWKDHIHPDDREWAVAECVQATKEHATHQLEYRMIAADGRTVWLRDIVRVVTTNHEPEELVGVMIDMTEKKNVERELQRSEDRLREVIDCIPVQIWSGPADGTLDFCNARWRSELGLSLNELHGNGWQQMLEPEDRNRVLNAWHESVTNGTPYEQQERHRMANGEYRWFLCRGVPLRYENGKIVRWFGSNTDINAQKKAEEALAESRQRWWAVFQNAWVGIALVDSSFRFVDVNVAYERMLGYSRDELRSMTLLDTSPVEDRLATQTLAEELKEGKRDHFNMEKREYRKDGQIIWVRVNGATIGAGDSKLGVIVAEDITERKRLSDQLLEERDRLRLLLDLNHQFVSKLNVREFFNALLDGLRRRAGWNWATILLPEVASDRLIVFLSPGNTYLREGFTVPIAASLQGEVYRSGKTRWFRMKDLPRLCPIYRESPWMQDIVRTEHVQVGCALPLIHKARIIGVLFLMTRATQDLTDGDLNFLHELASLVAAALNNTLQFERVNASHTKLLSERNFIEEQIRSEAGFEEIIGESTELKDILAQVNTVAFTDSTVLIIGETGTGKELIARTIHDRSPRREQCFIKVDCAAIPASLMESELFGHEKGAFTGAVRQRIGRFEAADQGTLFLDEIGDLPPDLQAKLLRVLQDHAFERVGSNQARHVDVRIISATNRNLEEMVENGKFREDLYYRLKVFPIVIPPLRDRPADIPPLVRRYMAKYSRRMKKDVAVVPPATMDVFIRYPWPGNVRELQHFIERSVIISKGKMLQAPVDELERLIERREAAQRGARKHRTLADVERESILKALEESNWVVGGVNGAAAKLGLKRTTLASRMEKLGISRRRT